MEDSPSEMSEVHVCGFERLKLRTNAIDVQSTVLVLGGGIAGLKVLYELQKKNVDTLLLEMRDTVGGVWSKSPHQAVYPGLILNTSLQQMLIDDNFCMKDDRDGYVSWQSYSKYLSEFVDQYIDQKDIYLNCRVTSIQKSSVSIYSSAVVEVEDSSIGCNQNVRKIAFHIGYIVVCQGACNIPRSSLLRQQRMEEVRVYHSSEISPEYIRSGSKVLLVGFGNTAGDYTVALERKDCVVNISTQNPTWVVPKYIDGELIDKVVQNQQRLHGEKYPEKLYAHIREQVYSSDPEALEAIDYRFSRIVKNDRLIDLLQKGKVQIKPKVEIISNDYIRFEDGNVVSYDIIVMCTDYEAGQSIFVDCTKRRQRLIANIFSQDWLCIYFAGTQPLWGGTGKLIDRQVSLIIEAISDINTQQELMDRLDYRENTGKKRTCFANGMKLYSLYEYMKLTEFVSQKEV